MSKTFYDAGTASVANGAVLITFADVVIGTVEDPNIKAGDFYADPAQPLVPPQRIASVDYEANTATLAVGWPGMSMVAAAYVIYWTDDTLRSTGQTRRVIEELSTVQANGRGFFFRFSDLTADADPGKGRLRFNTVDPTLTTAIYVDNLDANGAVVSAIVETWDDAGSEIGRGQVQVRSISRPSTFRTYKVTGAVVDGTGYRKLTVTHIGGSGVFAADEDLMIAFIPAGVRGESFTADAEVETLPGRAAYDGAAAGFVVKVNDNGDGRAGFYTHGVGAGVWGGFAPLTGAQGGKGDTGDKGWSPQLVAVVDGARRVLKLVGYVGGAGAAPTANVGEFLKGDGTFTSIIGDAVDFRGLAGAGTVAGLVAGTGIAVNPTDPTLPVVSAVVASQAEAEAGVANGALMTPQRTAQAIQALSPPTDLTPIENQINNIERQALHTMLELADLKGDRLGFVDGIADPFDDESDVDVVASQNEVYNPSTDQYSPVVTGETFVTTNTPSLDTDTPGHGGQLIRQRIPASLFSASGDQVRLTFAAVASGNSTIIAHCFVGHAGAAQNFDGSQVRVTFGGANGATIGAGSGFLVSDAVAFALDKTKDLIISMEFAATSDARVSAGAPASYIRYVKAGTGEAGATSVSGYAATPSRIWVPIVKIEARTAPGSVANMTLVSKAFAAAYVPARARLALQAIPHDAITANTDLKGFVSRNGGANWSQATLVLDPGTGLYVDDNIDLSAQPSGTSMRWKSANENNKNIDHSGVSLKWRT